MQQLNNLKFQYETISITTEHLIERLEFKYQQELEKVKDESKPSEYLLGICSGILNSIYELKQFKKMIDSKVEDNQNEEARKGE